MANTVDVIINYTKKGTGDKESLTAIQKLNKGFQDLTGISLSTFTAVALIGKGVQMFASFAKDAIKGASDLNETVSKTKVIFGDAADLIIDKSTKVADTMGQSGQSFLDAAATFGIFGKSAGLTGEALATFSTDLVGLATDLASFSNTTTDEAILSLGAALRGEMEPIRKYGVLLDDATLRQKALELGIIETTKNALSPQQRVLAAQALIFEQTSDAQGDFARTSKGLANQQRILKAETENLTAAIGVELLPAAIDVTVALVDLTQILGGTYDAAKHAEDGFTGLEKAVFNFNAGISGISEAVKIVKLFGAVTNEVFFSGHGMSPERQKEITDSIYGTTTSIKAATAALNAENATVEDGAQLMKGYTTSVKNTSVAQNELSTTVDDSVDYWDKYTDSLQAVQQAKFDKTLQDQKNAVDQLTQSYDDMNYAIDGQLGPTMKDFTDGQADLEQQMTDVKAEIDKAITDGYDPLGKKVVDLQGKYIDLKTQYNDNATAHDDATKRIMFNILTQRAAIGGLTEDEINYLAQIAKSWGLVDQATLNYMANSDASLNWLANHPGDVETAQKILEGQAGYWFNASLKAQDARDMASQYAGVINGFTDKTITITTIYDFVEHPGRDYGAQHGANFIVPPGYPNDTYPMRVSSGEHVVVQPANTFNINMTGTGQPAADIMSTVRLLELLYG